ncbi:MAG: 50S ribosomal protein L18 [Planctomycetota bacterium]|nr:50S ribosomal protein L18 [Planctomycetota bacterium]
MQRIAFKSIRRTRRKRSIRRRVFGVPDRPRLTVFRSARHIYAQLIDDLSGRTLAAASTVEKGQKVDNGGNRDAAAAVGKALADRAREAGISDAVFDRNGYRFHGRIKALAEAARKEGLKF